MDVEVLIKNVSLKSVKYCISQKLLTLETLLMANTKQSIAKNNLLIAFTDRSCIKAKLSVFIGFFWKMMQTVK